MIISFAMILGGLSLLLYATSSSAHPPTRLDNSTVTSLDLDRYKGVWYEIARKPHFFEKGMSHVKATYTLLPDGKIEVRNEGIKKGKLKVTFFLFPAQYNVLEIAPDYSYSVVGGSGEGYLWILSRTPTMDPSTLDGIFGRLRERGYDLSDVVLVEQ